MLDARFRAVGPRFAEGIAPAKLNLFLEVVARRPDGYHELATVFHEIDLADAIRVDLLPGGGDDELLLRGVALDGDPRDNLALEAARAFRRRIPAAGAVRVTLDKRVPPGTGMGGGSADAAFVLTALHHLCSPELPHAELAAAARDVGADVGFFLRGGTALGRGRGDELEPLAVAGPFVFVVAMPSIAISTALAYGEVDLIAPRRDVCSFAAGMAGDHGRAALVGCFNRLESAAVRLQPELGRVLQSLRETTDRAWVMTGSGSASFASMESEEEALSLVRAFSPRPGLECQVVRSFDRPPGLE
jgi:4-diphosphocytidyl-2-C-methyl-D-erythritol kinase